MSYSLDTDLLKEFSESDLAKLTGDPTGTTVDTSRIAYARVNADALIDSYLSGRYDVPFESPIDPIIAKLSLDITVANLYDYSNHRTSIPNTVVWRKLNAMQLLKDIQRGNVFLNTGVTLSGKENAIISNKTEDDKYFTKDLLDQFYTID
jgi:phage gp36-like protein